MISDIPPFDLKLGYELYSMLLKPVEAGWKQSKSLIVVTNGALGLLPLSLLPTAPAQIDANDDPLFSSYRAVPWLARNYAVTMVPSSAALRTLRQLPPGKAGTWRADCVRRSAVQCRTGSRSGESGSTPDQGGGCRGGHHARHAAQAPVKSEA